MSPSSRDVAEASGSPDILPEGGEDAEIVPELLPDLTGTQVAYYAYCQRKLWLFSHHIRMEQDSDLVQLGKDIHRDAYHDERKEVNINNQIVIDVVSASNVISEVKLSSRMHTVDQLQLKYYLYYLKRRGVPDPHGELRYPRERRRETVVLTAADEKELETIIGNVRKIVAESLPPQPFTELSGRCRKCSYQEYCWA
jgi:CRISPR-associated exonuclease Cas4